MVRRHLYKMQGARSTPAVPPVVPPDPEPRSSPTPSRDSEPSGTRSTSPLSPTGSASGPPPGATRPSESPPPPPLLLGRIHCFGDQPLEITDSLKGYRRQGLPDPVFCVDGSVKRPVASLEGGGGVRWRPLAGPLDRWWPLCRWLLVVAAVIAALSLIIFFLAKPGRPVSTRTLVQGGSGSDGRRNEPPTGDWSATEQTPVSTEIPRETSDPGVLRDQSVSDSPETIISKTSDYQDVAYPKENITITANSSTVGLNQTRSHSQGAKADDEEEVLYDSEELVIDGDDGDAEYEGDTDQTLPEFLESILSLWSTTPPTPARVLNGHRYGDTHAGDQWPVPSSPSPSSTRSPAPAVSPTLPPRLSLLHRATPTPAPDAPVEGECVSPRLSLCRGLLPYDLTLPRPVVPKLPALKTSADLSAAMPYFELVAASSCSPRAKAFLCPLLEPECVPRGVEPRRPCKRLCRAVAEDCADFVLNNLDLSRVFDCDSYDDNSGCLGLGVGGPCTSREFRCSDGSCIPQRWLCNGQPDCPHGSDERNCTVECPSNHFRCVNQQGCVRDSLRCDGRPDCSDGSDETGCAANTGAAALGAVSPCPAGELRCLDGRCIGLHRLCDGHPDCLDKADEANCPEKS